MRTFVLAAAVCLLSTAALADDTKPPSISGVKASHKGGKVTIDAVITDETGVLSATVHHRGKGGKVEDTPMTKAEYEDKFTASFSGGSDTEYWIEATDLLGNGPATYGTMGHPMALGGKPSSGKEVAQKEEKPAEEPKPEHHRERHHVAKQSAPKPEINHHAPSVTPPEGQEFTLHANAKNADKVVMEARPQGGTSFTAVVLSHDDGDSWSGKIPATLAKGTLEYFLIAQNAEGERAMAGSAQQPMTIKFKAAAAAPAVAAGPYDFAHYPLVRVEPNRPIVVRAQVTPSKDDGDMPDKVQVLYRGNDAQDMVADMQRDDNGGYGGYKAVLPAQTEGAVYYEIIACDGAMSKCGIDTGSKKKWHATAVAAQPGAAQPLPLGEPSAKAPPSLPE